MNDLDLELLFDILDNFDFEKVHKVMKFLDWKWSIEDYMEVPSVSELHKQARKMIQSAIKEVRGGRPEFYISSGGFTVEARMFEDGLNVHLYFSIASLEVNTADLND